jgi:hypothetical protein
VADLAYGEHGPRRRMALCVAWRCKRPNSVRERGMGILNTNVNEAVLEKYIDENVSYCRLSSYMSLLIVCTSIDNDCHRELHNNDNIPRKQNM